MTIIRAAFAYWAAIFALGFVLGSVRTVWGAQALGETAFILLEVPVLLTASALAARWLTRRYRVRSAGQAATMGALAFALVMGAEALLASTVTGQGANAWFASLWHPPHIYGTLGQVVFGVMPVVAMFSAKKTG